MKEARLKGGPLLEPAGIAPRPLLQAFKLELLLIGQLELERVR